MCWWGSTLDPVLAGPGGFIIFPGAWCPAPHQVLPCPSPSWVDHGQGGKLIPPARTHPNHPGDALPWVNHCLERGWVFGCTPSCQAWGQCLRVDG